MGGDAESHLKLDMRNCAGFVRHHSRVVNNFLLPIKVLSVTWANTNPRVEECLQLCELIQ